MARNGHTGGEQATQTVAREQYNLGERMIDALASFSLSAGLPPAVVER